MNNEASYGVVFASKFKNENVQYALVTRTGVYRMVSEVLNSEHELNRITQMRDKPKDVERFLQGQPEFTFYSKELTHLPGVIDFFNDGQFDIKRLSEVKSITPASNLTLEYLASIPLETIKTIGKAA